MRGRWSRRVARAASGRGRAMARRRWEMDRARRDAEEPEWRRELAEIEAENLPRMAGDVLGSLTWHDHRSGRVRRWTVLVGERRDQVVLRAADGRRTGSHGWTWVLDHLRGYLAGRKG